MPLVNYKPLIEEIKIGPNGENGTLTVRGVGFPEIAQLIEVHQASIAPLFDRATGKDKKHALTADSLDNMASTIMTTAPAAVAHLIALAADEPVTVINSLPLDVQFEALVKIGTLTFKTAGGAKNFLESVTTAMAGVSALAKENRQAIQASMNGLKESAAIAPS